MGRKAVFCLLHYLAVVFTAGMFALALLSRHASSVAPGQGGLWVTLALIMPVILGVNLLAFVWWLIRRRWLVALMPVAALVLNLGYLSAMVRLPGHNNGAASAADLRIATLNTYGFRDKGKTGPSALAIARMAEENRFDIFCMQEFLPSDDFSTEDIAALFAPRMPYFIREQGQALVSRFPVVAWRYVRFPETNNDYLVADLDVGGKPLRVISVHLQTSGINALRHRFRKDFNREVPVDILFGEIENNSRIRAGQVDELCAIIDSSRMPLVLAGDFNDTPSSYSYRRVREKLTDGFVAAGSGYAGTFRYMGGILRIDYIFCGPGLECVGYYLPRGRVSDHKAVAADFRFDR